MESAWRICHRFINRNFWVGDFNRKMRRTFILHDPLIYLAWVEAVFMLTIILEGRDMTALRVSKSEVEGQSALVSERRIGST
ncbi:hypothetical protein CFN79_20110 [Chromobacterium vaccinii]|nr:hypothetical protein CFN79_20110 [Chromobacterium vaccinii]